MIYGNASELQKPILRLNIVGRKRLFKIDFQYNLKGACHIIYTNVRTTHENDGGIILGTTD